MPGNEQRRQSRLHTTRNKAGLACNGKLLPSIYLLQPHARRKRKKKKQLRKKSLRGARCQQPTASAASETLPKLSHKRQQPSARKRAARMPLQHVVLCLRRSCELSQHWPQRAKRLPCQGMRAQRPGNMPHTEHLE